MASSCLTYDDLVETKSCDWKDIEQDVRQLFLTEYFDPVHSQDLDRLRRLQSIHVSFNVKAILRDCWRLSIEMITLSYNGDQWISIEHDLHQNCKRMQLQWRGYGVNSFSLSQFQIYGRYLLIVEFSFGMIDSQDSFVCTPDIIDLLGIY